MVVLLLVLYMRRKYRRQTGLQEKLLAQRDDELEALKQAWEIDPSDIKLEERIDGDSPGAFGHVYRASWLGLSVAVKMLDPALLQANESAAREFAREVEFMQTCRHANMMRLFGTGIHADTSAPFLVMELAAAGTLTSYVRKAAAVSPGLSWYRKRELVANVAAGMAYIHGLNRMHRDLKTSNVLVTDNGVAKIADFGTMRQLTSLQRLEQQQGDAGSRTGWRALLPFGRDASAIQPLISDLMMTNMSVTVGTGTPRFMAPEVLRGERYGMACDVFSYALVVYDVANNVEDADLPSMHGWQPGRGSYLVRLELLYESGKRLPLSTQWPLWVHRLCSSCWQQNATERPSFPAILRMLSEQDDAVVDIAQAPENPTDVSTTSEEPSTAV